MCILGMCCRYHSMHILVYFFNAKLFLFICIKWMIRYVTNLLLRALTSELLCI
jgi:hypothetical protein